MVKKIPLPCHVFQAQIMVQVFLLQNSKHTNNVKVLLMQVQVYANYTIRMAGA